MGFILESLTFLGNVSCGWESVYLHVSKTAGRQHDTLYRHVLFDSAEKQLCFIDAKGSICGMLAKARCGHAGPAALRAATFRGGTAYFNL